MKRTRISNKHFLSRQTVISTKVMKPVCRVWEQRNGCSIYIKIQEFLSMSKIFSLDLRSLTCREPFFELIAMNKNLSKQSCSMYGVNQSERITRREEPVTVLHRVDHPSHQLLCFLDKAGYI